MVFVLPFENTRVMTVLVLALIATAAPTPMRRPLAAPVNQVRIHIYAVDCNSDRLTTLFAGALCCAG